MSNIFYDLGQKIYDWTHPDEQYPDIITSDTETQEKSSLSDIWNAAIGTINQTTQIGTPVSTEQLQAVSTGVAEGTIKSIDNIKDISKYLAITGIIVVGLIIYSKLK